MQKINGFSLIELSVSILIISVLIGTLVSLESRNSEAEKVAETRKRMEYVDKAVASYLSQNRAIPCPADASLPTNDANFGVATRSGSLCSGSEGGAWYIDPGFQEIDLGSVPTKTLGIPEKYAFDAWGNRLNYTMIQRCNVNSDESVASNFEKVIDCGGPGNFSMTINDRNGNPKATGVIYLLMSHGKKNHGNYPRNGGSIRVNAGANVSADEEINGLMTSAGADIKALGTYVERQYQDNFNFLLSYYNKERLIRLAKLISPSQPSFHYLCSIFDNDFPDPMAGANAMCGPFQLTAQYILCTSYFGIIVNGLNPLCMRDLP